MLKKVPRTSAGMIDAKRPMTNARMRNGPKTLRTELMVKRRETSGRARSATVVATVELSGIRNSYTEGPRSMSKLLSCGSVRQRGIQKIGDVHDAHLGR